MAYALAQAGRLEAHSYVYLALNLIGSAILAVLALADRQAGFLLLEGSWAIISAGSIVVRLRGEGAEEENSSGERMAR